MKYETIADIYSANQNILEKLTIVLSGISPDEATALPDGEKWSIKQIAEHVSMVDFGVSRVCAKLLEAARSDGKPSDGSFELSASFRQHAAEIANRKAEAPERVQPTGGVTIAEAVETIRASRTAFDSLRDDFEQYDFSGPKFPHPYFGDLTAGEWLVLVGLHEQRHTQQIVNLLEKIRQ